MEISNYYYMPDFYLGNSTEIKVNPTTAIIVDTSALISEGIESIFEQLINNKIRLYEPVSIYHELKKVAAEKPEKAPACNRAYEVLSYILNYNQNVVTLSGGMFSDPDIICQVIQGLYLTDMVIITNDVRLSNTIKNIPKVIAPCITTYKHKLTVGTFQNGQLVRA